MLTIWILILISLMAASLAAQTQSNTRIAHNRSELAVAKGLADAGIALGLNGLLDPVVANRWPADGRAPMHQLQILAASGVKKSTSPAALSLHLTRGAASRHAWRS